MGNDYTKPETKYTKLEDEFDQPCIGEKCKKKYCLHHLDGYKIYVYDNKNEKYIAKIDFSKRNPERTYRNTSSYYKDIARGLYNYLPRMAVFFLVVLEYLRKRHGSGLYLKIRTKPEIKQISHLDKTYYLFEDK